jgi:hypothetical protein
MFKLLNVVAPDPINRFKTVPTWVNMNLVQMIQDQGTTTYLSFSMLEDARRGQTTVSGVWVSEKPEQIGDAPSLLGVGNG